MDRKKAEHVLAQLESLQEDHEISILRLSEPISSAIAQSSTSVRTSDASTSSLDTPTPASLEADLAHYKELFAKLRFSYVEQVTKEKFIRAIVGDPPLIVSPQENLDLEKHNLAAKSQLKTLKMEVADMVDELEKKGRELTRRYEGLQTEMAALRELPDKMEALDQRIAELRAAQEPGADPRLHLPLARTLELVEQKTSERDELDRQLAQLQSLVPRKGNEVERLRAEVQTLEVKRQNSATAAKEARRRKQAALGGVQDDLEERGRWFRASETLLVQMLES